MPLPCGAQGLTPLPPTSQTCCFMLFCVAGAGAAMEAAGGAGALPLFFLGHILATLSVSAHETQGFEPLGPKNSQNQGFARCLVEASRTRRGYSLQVGEPGKK